MSAACRLCGGATRRLFERAVLRRHRVAYHQCGTCGLTQTDAPTWLDEAYAEPIHRTDTGVLARNLGARNVVATFLHLAGAGAAPCLDFAAGHGFFVRLMRDAGFAFFWSDPMAENLVARGFEWDGSKGTPFAVTALEVLEHFVRPLEGFREIAAHGARFIVTSTELHPGPAPGQDWPYLSPESGQHVSFYRPDTLKYLGRECGYPVVHAGPFIQVFARAPFPAWQWKLATRFGALLYPIVRRLRPSLTVSDCEGIREGLRRPEPGPRA